MPRIVYQGRHDYLNIAQRDQVPASMSPLERMALSGHLSCLQCSNFFITAGSSALTGIHEIGTTSQSSGSGKRPIRGTQHDDTDRKVRDRADHHSPKGKGSKLHPTAKPFIPQYQPLSMDAPHDAQVMISEWNAGIGSSQPIPSGLYSGLALATSYPRGSSLHLSGPSFGHLPHSSADTGFSGKVVDPFWTFGGWPNAPWHMQNPLSDSTHYLSGHRRDDSFLTQGQH